MKTWFVTGANRGLGAEIARAALKAGDNVVATARQTAGVEQALTGHAGQLFVVPLDITDVSQVAAAVTAAKTRFGRIDVLVNNAGFAQLGAFEEIPAKDIEDQFATNVFGTFHVTRAVLPIMREQRSGHVITISSLVGLMGFDGSSIYCSTKFAIEGWSESLALELANFDIKVTLIEPGMFRTDFLDESSARYGSLEIDDYAAASAVRKAGLAAFNRNQPGDPVKLGSALVKLVASDDPPVRFAAGPDALEVMQKKAETLLSQSERWCELSSSTSLGE